MSPADALRSATSVAARVLGREEELGRVARGHIADFVGVRADPLKDVSALREPVLVIKRGALILHHR